MAGFNVANNYDPSVWIPGITEKASTRPNLVNSGILAKSEQFNEVASGPSSKADFPFFRSIADQAEGVQAERTPPTPQGQSTDKQVCVILNRETSNDLSAMSANLGALDPLGDLLGQIAQRRVNQLQQRLLHTMRGMFGVTAIANALSVDNFKEVTASITATDVMDSKYVIDAVAKLGDEATSGGIMVVHPIIRAALLKLDEKDFFRGQEGSVILERYKGMPLYTSKLLVRAGTGAGTPNVYESFIALPGSFGFGEKPQVAGDNGNPAIDVASINLIKDAKTNVVELIDRTRTVVHPSGMKWLGAAVTGSSPTNAELANAANWAMVANAAELIGVVRIRTNG